MCSFLFSSSYVNENVEELNQYLQSRGPDLTTTKVEFGFLYLHNLLSITGTVTPQPLETNNIRVLFNGEIYNYKEHGQYNSDGECLIPLYQKYGSLFIKKLDGEFAICLIDRQKQIAIFSTDIFRTKPLYYALDNGLVVSTYKDPIIKLGKNPIKAEPNTMYVVCLKTHKLLTKDTLYKFSLMQYKSKYDDWIEAFQSAIKKRINTNKKIFIGLSAGYDSGLIYAELLKNNCSFNSYTIYGKENEQILRDRLSLTNKHHSHIKLLYNKPIHEAYCKYIESHTEPYHFTIRNASGDFIDNRLLTEDKGSASLARICSAAKKDGCKVFLSGMGADEIISDYGFNGHKFGPHSNFGGLFPENLSSIFPWPSFYESTMESYLAKEEYVTGCYGIETRYPFLDKQVVQEFLWLKSSLKNLAYKAPIDEYFKQNNFPYEPGKKSGFSIKNI